MQYIFLHGLGQNASSWDATLLHFFGKSYSVCPELSSFFTSENCTYADLYQNFKNFCNAKSNSLHLCGLSLGAILALHYAMDYPEKVRSLVLIAPQYKIPKALLYIQNIIFHCMPQSVFSAMGMQKADFIHLSSSMIHLDFSDRLSVISCKTLVLCGERDWANRTAALKITDRIQDAEMCFVRHAMHEVNTEQPQILAELLRNFYCNQTETKSFP